MMTIFRFIYTSLTLLILVSSSAHASGIVGNDDSGEAGWDETDIGLSEFSGRLENQQSKKKADPAYEIGKSVYYGKQQGIPKLSYCLSYQDGKKKLKRKVIKSYKNTSFSALASDLVSCDEPSNYIKMELPRYEFLHVLYYLDKRYKLNLKRE